MVMASFDNDDEVGGDYMVMTKGAPGSGSTVISTVQQRSSVASAMQRPQSSSPAEFQVIPTEVDCNGSTDVVLLFERDVSRVEVCLTVPSTAIGPKSSAGISDRRLFAARITSRAFKFTAPESREGHVDMSLTVDGRQCSTRRRLTYQSPSLRLARGLSTLYVHHLDALCQYVVNRLTPAMTASSVMGEVDRVLVASLDDSESVVPVHAYEDLFGVYSAQAMPHAAGGGKRSPSAADDFTVALTLLHLAAGRGLTNLAERLVDLPDSAEAARSCRDENKQTPGERARKAGHMALADRLDKLAGTGSDPLNHKLNNRHTIAVTSPILPPRSPVTVAHRSSVTPSLLSGYDVPSRVYGEVDRDYVNKCPTTDRDVVDYSDDYVDSDATVANRRRKGATSSSSSQDLERDGTDAPKERPQSSLHRQSSYLAATAVEDNENLLPPAFRPPPPPSTDVRSGNIVGRAVVEPIGVTTATNGVPSPVSARWDPVTRSANDKRAADSPESPPPVAPRTGPSRISLTAGNTSARAGARMANLQQQSSGAASANVGKPRSATTVIRGASVQSTDDIAWELDQIVPAPRSAQPTTSRT